MSSEFQIGDLVEWESATRAGLTKKRGEVVELVRPWRFPNRMAISAWATPMFGRILSARPHPSYLVKVSPESSRAKPKVYWPRVKYLQRVEGQDETTGQ